jgi:hypothetical protein
MGPSNMSHFLSKQQTLIRAGKFYSTWAYRKFFKNLMWLINFTLSSWRCSVVKMSVVNGWYAWRCYVGEVFKESWYISR